VHAFFRAGALVLQIAPKAGHQARDTGVRQTLLDKARANAPTQSSASVDDVGAGRLFSLRTRHANHRENPGNYDPGYRIMDRFAQARQRASRPLG